MNIKEIKSIVQIIKKRTKKKRVTISILLNFKSRRMNSNNK